MNVTFANGTARQRQWVSDAIAACQYPLHMLNANVTVQFTTLTACQNLHTYMCTDHHGSGTDFTIQIEPWADDPTNVNNLGLADPNRDLHEFFIDSFVHEIGHVWQFFIPGNLADICSNFVHIPDGRRGTAADYNGTEITQNQWSELIKEALSEWFRLAYLPERQVYGNRTRWSLNARDFKTLFRLASFTIYEFDTPVDCSAVLGFTETGEVLFPKGGVYETITLGPPTFGDPNDPVFDANPTFAWDYIFEFTNEASGVAMQATAMPTIFHDNEQLLLSFASFGSSATQFLPGDLPGMLAFDKNVDDWTGPPDFLEAFLNPGQPAFQGHSVTLGGGGVEGIPALQGQPSTPRLPLVQARGGWKTSRFMSVEVDLPPTRADTGWGVLELTLLGQNVGREEPFATSATAEYGLDADGKILSMDDQFSGAPWGTLPSVIRGTGPFADNPAPPTLQGGWMIGCALVDQITFPTSSGGNGAAGVLKGVAHEYLPPTETFQPPPDSPCDSSSSEDGGGGVSVLHEYVTSFAPVLPYQAGNARVVGPRRQKQMFVVVFSGFTQGMDAYTGLGVRARYFPVKVVNTGSPQPKDPGKTIGGPVQGGSVRSKKDIALARRELQAVERVSGGTPH